MFYNLLLKDISFTGYNISHYFCNVFHLGQHMKMRQAGLLNYSWDFQVHLHCFCDMEINPTTYFSALRSIGLKCMEHLFFFKIIGETGAGLDAHLFDLLEPSDN